MTEALEKAYFPEDDIDTYEDYVFSVARKKVLRYLYANHDPQSIEDVLLATKVSINLLAKIYIEISSLKLDFIRFNNDGLQLTDSGKRWVFNNRRSIFLVRKVRRGVKKNIPRGLDMFSKLPEKYTLR